jgi:hypothetical protein
LYEERKLGAYPSSEEVKTIMGQWRRKWEEVNHDGHAIAKMMEITKRTPTRALECFVFGGGLDPMSTPFLMPVITPKGALRTDEDFVQTMIHELLHIFLATNTKAYWTMAREKYSDKDPITQNHIIVFAMLGKIYQDLFGYLPPDFENEDLREGYKQAMKIVTDRGYEELVSEYDALVQPG